MALSWRRRGLDEVRREEAPEQFAIRDELVSIRPWFDADLWLTEQTNRPQERE